MRFDYPWKLIPWHRKPEGGASQWMIDSGVRQTPPTVDELVEAQLQYADVAVNPDVLGDAEATLKRTAVWMERMRLEAPQIRRVVCTQGSIVERLGIMDTFPDVHAYGFGMHLKEPDVKFEPEERERYLRALVPEAHSRGKRVHVFGVGTTGPVLSLLRELKVESFDSSAPVLMAVVGRIYDQALRQVQIGGARTADAKRLRLYLNLSMIRHAIDNGPSIPEENLTNGLKHIEGQRFLFGEES